MSERENNLILQNRLRGGTRRKASKSGRFGADGRGIPSDNQFD